MTEVKTKDRGPGPGWRGGMRERDTSKVTHSASENTILYNVWMHIQSLDASLRQGKFETFMDQTRDRMDEYGVKGDGRGRMDQAKIDEVRKFLGF